MSSARRTIPKLPTPAVVTFEYEIDVSRPDSRQRASTEKTVSGSAPRQLLHRALREAWVRGSERTNVVCTREDRPRNGCAARSWHRLSSRRLRREDKQESTRISICIRIGSWDSWGAPVRETPPRRHSRRRGAVRTSSLCALSHALCRSAEQPSSAASLESAPFPRTGDLATGVPADALAGTSHGYDTRRQNEPTRRAVRSRMERASFQTS